TDARAKLLRPLSGVASAASEQHFVDEQLRAIALACALLVMARDHFADQSEGEELHPDDDEEDAECEERSSADCVTEHLVDGQVDEDSDADRRQSEAESSEKVQRSVAVTADEGDRQQIEEAAQVTLEPVSRAAVLARTMVDG